MNSLERKECVVLTAKRMLEVAIDEVVSLKQLSDAAGRDVSADRWIVQSALRTVNAEYGLIFATVRGEGYRRLAHSDGALFAGNRGLYRVRRASRAALKAATNAQRHANDMTAEQRRRHNQQMSALGLIGHLTMNRTVEVMPEAPPRPDPLAGLREALGI